jgi:hypothetical protein
MKTREASTFDAAVGLVTTAPRMAMDYLEPERAVLRISLQNASLDAEEEVEDVNEEAGGGGGGDGRGGGGERCSAGEGGVLIAAPSATAGDAGGESKANDRSERSADRTGRGEGSVVSGSGTQGVLAEAAAAAAATAARTLGGLGEKLGAAVGSVSDSVGAAVAGRGETVPPAPYYVCAFDHSGGGGGGGRGEGGGKCGTSRRQTGICMCTE